MKIRRSGLKDTVRVTTRTGTGAAGPIDAAPLDVQCTIDETCRMDRDAAGAEQVSECTLLLHPLSRATNPATPDARSELVGALAVFAPESPLIVRGRPSRVISVSTRTVRGQVLAVQVRCS